MSEIILNALAPYGLKAQGGGEYRCRSPYRVDSDNLSFTYNAVKGTGFDQVSKLGYNDYEIAERLGIELPRANGNGRSAAPNTLKAYATLAEYAQFQGVDVSVFERAKWVMTKHADPETFAERPCFSFPTQSGTRYRFTDGNPKLAKYTSQKGYKACWYGLKSALAMGLDVLIICNGEASTLVAQRYNVPATCKTAGEQKLPEYMIAELDATGFNGEIWLALDCDKTGRAAAIAIQGQLPRAKVIDLGLTDKGDLANFCMLYGDASLDALRAKLPKPVVIKPAFISHSTVAINAIETIEFGVKTGYPLPIPFQCMHYLGGFAKAVRPGKVVMIIAATGAGKTSIMETWVDWWLQRGISGLMRGDEWTPAEYHDRRITRHCGVTMDEVMAHEMYKTEAALNMPYRSGVQMAQARVLEYQQCSMWIAEWRGQVFHYNISEEKNSLEDSLTEATNTITQQRKNGKLMAFAVFDYVQLLKSAERATEENSVEFVFGKIKKFAQDNQVVAVVGSQANKDASKDGQRNKLITSFDAHYVRTDKANLALVLNPEYEPDPEGKLNSDGTPMLVETNRATISVDKNSGGSRGKIKVLSDLARYRWLDTQTQVYDLQERDHD